MDYRTFATLILNTQKPRDLAPNIPSLRHVAGSKAKAHHQLVKDPRDVHRIEVPVRRRWGGECVARHRGSNQVIRQRSRRVAFTQNGQEGDELEETPLITLHFSMIYQFRRLTN